MPSFAASFFSVGLVGILAVSPPVFAEPVFRAEEKPGEIVIYKGEQALLRYVYQDDTVKRPYFCDVKTLSGIQVTRNHPPADGDLQDHATYHPGIWLAFGDLNGADSWRGKATVEHVEFGEKPALGRGILTFTVRNRYWNDAHDAALCDEVCTYYLTQGRGAYLLVIESTFTPQDQALVFGDQEEMGLGVRMATGLSEKTAKGSVLTDGEFRTTARAVWGRQSDWCDYSGAIGGKPAGVTVFSHPGNFRRPWWHARDYGLLVANPFGRKAFTGGETSRIVVEPGKDFQLRYGIVVHDGRPGQDYNPLRTAMLYRQW
jgi:hypothetical protein